MTHASQQIGGGHVVGLADATASSASPAHPLNESLLLKWGTLKGWDLKSEASREAARTYFGTGSHSAGCMSQHDTAEQKQALCALIDAIDGYIQNDWSGEMMTKDQAKAYVLEYGSAK